MRLTRLAKRERALTETKESDYDSDPRYMLKKERARAREKVREREREILLSAFYSLSDISGLVSAFYF